MADLTLAIWDLDEPTVPLYLSRVACATLADKVTALDISGDWRWALLGLTSEYVLLWNIVTGECVHEWRDTSPGDFRSYGRCCSVPTGVVFSASIIGANCGFVT